MSTLLILQSFVLSWVRWEGNPVLFQIPEFSLPFPLSLVGFALSFLIYYALSSQFGGSSGSTKSGKGSTTSQKSAGKSSLRVGVGKSGAGSSLPGWTLIVISLIGGQLLTVPFDIGLMNSIGPIAPRWYGLMFACAFFFGYLMGGNLLKRYGVSDQDLDRLLIYVMVGTVVGARLGHVIFYDLEYYLMNPHLIPQVWTGGLASHGAAIAIPIALWLYVRKTKGVTFLSVTDRVITGVAVGGFFIRFGNFFNSEILGRPTDLPWAIIFARIDDLPRHPTMLYESLWCIVVLLAVLAVYRAFQSRPPQGAMFGVFLITLFTGRFFLEFTKVPQAEFAADWSINMGQWLSVPFVLIGIYLLVRIKEWKPE